MLSREKAALNVEETEVADETARQASRRMKPEMRDGVTEMRDGVTEIPGGSYYSIIDIPRWAELEQDCVGDVGAWN